MKPLGILLFSVVLVAVVIAAWRGWFDFSVSDQPDDRVQLELDIDKGKMKQDAKDFADSSRKAVDRTVDGIEDLARGEDDGSVVDGSAEDGEVATADGVVVRLDNPNQLLVVDVAGDSRTFHVPAETKVVPEEGSESTPEDVDDLHPGDKVVVTYRVEGDRRVAEQVRRKATVNS